jgi:predicted DNA-binding protein with PD1-like motif
MIASEGKPGRVFFLRLEEGDSVESIRRFAGEKGIHAGEVLVLGERTVAGMIVPDAEGRPGLRLPDGFDMTAGCDVVLREVLGFHFQRVRDPASGLETLASVASTKTRVLDRPAPTPGEAGPGTIPVYLFNAEFN